MQFLIEYLHINHALFQRKCIIFLKQRRIEFLYMTHVVKIEPDLKKVNGILN